MPEAPLIVKDDSTLIAQAKSGDTQAFGILYERYVTNIYRFICAQLPDSNDAEDLTAEIFLKAWSAISRYRERGYPFSAFLFKIARNVLIDFRRKNLKEVKRSQELIDSIKDRNIQISDEIVSRQTHQNLWNFLGELRENYRSVLVFRFINGLTTREISRIMGRSEGNIRVMQHRALSDLRKKMDLNRIDP